MPPYPTCSHIKEDGSFCQVAALREQKYCYYHLEERARALRRARARRDNAPFCLETRSFDSPYAVRNGITEIIHALGDGRLDATVAGKMLYGIQLLRTENKKIAAIEAAVEKTNDPSGPQLPSSGNCGESSPAPRVQELPNFNQQLSLDPGEDIDDRIQTVSQSADEAAADRQPLPMPPPPVGVRPGSPAWRAYLDDRIQEHKSEIQSLRYLLRGYYAEQQLKVMKATENMYLQTGVPMPDSIKKGVASAEAAVAATANLPIPLTATQKEGKKPA